MKRTLLLCLIFVMGSFAVEEIDEESVAQLTDDLLHEIEKRLRDDPAMLDALMEKSGDLLGALEDECRHRVVNDTIIETEKSIENGAMFLLTPNVNSYSECLQSCCDTENCNTAIFKDRDDAYACYLFDCGNPTVCEYSDHQDFYIMIVEQSRDKIAAKHENDLDNLAMQETSTTSSTTTTTTTSVKPTEAPRLPSALYDTCRDTEDCAGSGTVCESGYCVCHSDYHPQDGICRKKCTRFQFECENKGNPLDYPQCIAIYDRCDGIDHCDDSSDEMGCDENQDSASSKQGSAEANVPGEGNQQIQPQQPVNPQAPPNQPQPALYDQSYGYPGYQAPAYNAGYDNPYAPQFSPYGQPNANPQYQGVPQVPANNPNGYAQNMNRDRNPVNNANGYVPDLSSNLNVPNYASSQSGYAQDLGNNRNVQNNQNGYGQDRKPIDVSADVNNGPRAGAASAMDTSGDQRALQRKRPYPEMPPNPSANIPNGDNSRQNYQPAPKPLGPLQNHDQTPASSQGYGYNNPGNEPAQMGNQRDPNRVWGQENSRVNDMQNPGPASRYGDDVVHSRVNAKKYHEMEEPTAPPTTRPAPAITRASTPVAKVPERTRINEKQPDRPAYANPHPGRGPHGGYISEGGEVGISKQNNQQRQPPAKSADPLSGQDNSRDSQPSYNPYTDRKSSRQDVYRNPYQSNYGDSYRPSYGYKDASDYASKYGYNQGYGNAANRGWGNGYTGNGFGSFYNYDDSPPSFVNQYGLPNHFYDYYEDLEPQGNQAYPPKNTPAPDQHRDPARQPPSQQQHQQSEEEPSESNQQGDSSPIAENPEDPDSSEEAQSHDIDDTHDKASSQQSTDKLSEETDSDKNSENSSEEPDSGETSENSDDDRVSGETSENADDSNDSLINQADSSKSEKPVKTYNNKTENNMEEEWRDQRIEKLEVPRPSNRTAVVALSLGLIITAMMLVFVGCRLRNVRKRLRKGRPMNSNEADYLINGMYL